MFIEPNLANPRMRLMQTIGHEWQGKSDKNKLHNSHMVYIPYIYMFSINNQRVLNRSDIFNRIARSELRTRHNKKKRS